MLNRIILIGRLSKEPELRYTTNGTAVCSFTLAVESGFGEKKRTDFINIVVWNKLAENCATYLAKGKLAAVDGRLQIRSYEDKDGVKRYVTEVVAENVRFLSPRGEAKQEEAPWPEMGEPMPPRAQMTEQQAVEFAAQPEEDLPF